MSTQKVRPVAAACAARRLAVLEGPLAVEVVAELGQLDRDLAVEASFRDRVEEREVVLGDRVGLLDPGHVLAEPGEHGRDALRWNGAAARGRDSTPRRA